MESLKIPSPNNKSCFEMLEENCKGCDNAFSVDGDYCGVLRGFEKGREYERKKIIEILDSSLEQGEGIYKLTQYLIQSKVDN